jgi:acetylornithine/N-succinyldiaminopimelate aminotransferase
MTGVARVELKHLMKVAERPDVVFTHGKGSWLYDDKGQRYLDFVQGWAVNALGHSHPSLVAAIQQQVERLLSAGPGYHNDMAPRLAQRLAAISGLERFFFANSGAEANEGAIKLARKWGAIHRGGAFRIITMENGFHGRTLATMSATGKPAWETLFEPKVTGFIKVPFNDLDAIAAAIDESVVAVMLEPVQGEGGVIPAKTGYLESVRELTQTHGLLLILDEVQTGLGRTGFLFAFQQTGILPDMLTLGKGMGGGFPLAALAASEAVCCFDPGDQGGTFNGNPLAASAGLAVLTALESPGFIETIKRNGTVLRERLEGLSQRYQQAGVRGQGLFQALVLTHPIGKKVVDAALQSGLLINSPRPNVLRFMPALNVIEEEIEEMIVRLDAILAACHKAY